MTLKSIILERTDKIAFILCTSESFILEQDIEVICETIKNKEKGENNAIEKLESLGEVDKIDYIIQTTMFAIENEMHFSRIKKFPSLSLSSELDSRIFSRFKIRLLRDIRGLDKPLSLCRSALHRLYKECSTRKRQDKIVTHLCAFNTAFKSLNYRIKTLCLYLESEEIGKTIIVDTVQMMFSHFIRDSLMLIKYSTAFTPDYDNKSLFDFYRGILGWWINKDVDYSVTNVRDELHQVIKNCEAATEITKAMKQIEDIDVMMISIKMLIRKKNMH